MNKLEQLEQEAFENAVKVHNYYLGEENLKGIYIDGNIAINTSVDNGAEKACVLAEELGHYHTTVGACSDIFVDLFGIDDTAVSQSDSVLFFIKIRLV